LGFRGLIRGWGFVGFRVWGSGFGGLNPRIASSCVGIGTREREPPVKPAVRRKPDNRRVARPPAARWEWHPQPARARTRSCKPRSNRTRTGFEPADRGGVPRGAGGAARANPAQGAGGKPHGCGGRGLGVQGFEGAWVQGCKGCRPRGFKGFRVFTGSRARGSGRAEPTPNAPAPRARAETRTETKRTRRARRARRVARPRRVRAAAGGGPALAGGQVRAKALCAKGSARKHCASLLLFPLFPD
jgi:hypothetical protein